MPSWSHGLSETKYPQFSVTTIVSHGLHVTIVTKNNLLLLRWISSFCFYEFYQQWVLQASLLFGFSYKEIKVVL